MPSVETEVDQPAGNSTAQGAAMEITVSRQDLVKELTATQSVVERKTTIPILSNFLIEAEGDRLNITGQHLETRGDIGYAIIDVDDEQGPALASKIAALPGTIRSRLVY